jgi:hypothetical protein
MKTTAFKLLAYAIVLIVFSAYLYAMVIDPLLLGGWDRLHKVWFDWQTFNSAMIALGAALLGLYSVKKQLDRQFNAARALLPDALSTISCYLDNIISVLNEALRKLSTEEANKQHLDIKEPTLENEYKNVFSVCISHGPIVLQDILTEISVEIQITRARLQSLYSKEFTPESTSIKFDDDILSEIVRTLKIKKLIENTFPYARNHSKNILHTKMEQIKEINYAHLDANLISRISIYLNKANK